MSDTATREQTRYKASATKLADDALARELAYWHQARRVGRSQRRWLDALEAELVRRQPPAPAHHRYVVCVELDSIMDPARVIVPGRYSTNPDEGTPPILGDEWLAGAIRDHLQGILVDDLAGYVLRVTASPTGDVFADDPASPF